MTAPTGRARAAVGTVAFFCLAPGLVAGLGPWLVSRWRIEQPFRFYWPARLAGALLILAAVAFLVNAFVRFVVEGIGTPAPVAPTDRLVVGGVYRHVRNPMYLAVVAAIVGQALLLGQARLLAYAAVVAAIQAAFVRLHEEPELHHRYGGDYDAYRHAVPAWRPRWRAWTGPGPARST